MELKSNEFNTGYDSIQKNFIKHTHENILNNRIDELITKTKIYGFVTKEPILFEDRLNYELKEYQIGEKWGNLFECAWFKITGKITDFDPDINYELKLDLSGEAAIFDEFGTPYKGFTNGSSAFDFNLGYPGKLYSNVNSLIKSDGSFEFWVEAGANDLFGNLSADGKVMISEIVVRNQKMLKLYFDFVTLYSTLIALPKEAPSYYDLFQTLLEASYKVIYENENWLEDAITIIDNYYISNKNSDFLYTAIGHAHMDLAWLWPIRETRRKVGRFITNMFYLIEKYDSFVFGISQPQQLKWLKEDYPKLYEQFKKYVADGKIELQGAMWVEPDTNVPGEESLVRQMLYGQNYYLKEFGKRVDNLWLPDVFGYNGNMPQIIKKSGLDYFMTIKISWSLINEFPHHSFFWQGVDGSKVLTHMPPEGTYNSPADPRFLLDGMRKYKEIDIAPIALTAYGIGNGGGGPGIEHVERILRVNQIPDIPNIEFGRADYFFNKLTKYQNKLPTYQGELYLENHQGTYTSQSNIKKYNLMMEQKLKTFETMLVLTNKYNHYRNLLNDLWEETLLYQFHDILPGSSIKRVYDEALDRYQIMVEKIDKAIGEVTNYQKGYYRFNPLLSSYSKLFKQDNKYLRYNFKPLSKDLPVNEYEMIGVSNNNIIETNNLKITLSRDSGQFTSIVIKDTNFELLTRPEANKLLVYKDLGDGWNIEPHYRKQQPTLMKLTNQEIKDYNDIIEVVNDYQFKNSKLKETIVIDKLTDDIIFNHELDWKDVGHMLRTSFPLNIDANEALFDIQFGHLKRSRLNDNTINKAQFEVSGQQWVNISDANNNVSLLTKGKYGFYVKEDLLDINLLRSTNSPGKDGDIDKTTYTYQLLINAKDLVEVDQKALFLNTYIPLTDQKFETLNLFEIDNQNINVSAIKLGHNDNDIYIRLYNRTDSEQITTLKTNFEKHSLYETNLIEENPIEINNKLIFSKFEIKTVKIILEK